MTLKKRGLGRGLEALLADVPVKEDLSESVDRAVVDAESVHALAVDLQKAEQLPHLSSNVATVDDQAEMAIALVKNIHRERLELLKEAEALKVLIDEFESIVHADLL
ncbi:MAG: hypothetical protein ACXWTS_05330 [Methylococcaceae bacterium]